MEQDNRPSIQIEILEGHVSSPSPYSYFWFRPVKIPDAAHITYENVIKFDEEFSIEQSNVDIFLLYFLSKYFDGDLIYNQKRSGADPAEFHLCGQNFFTYETVRTMLHEIIKTADLFVSDYESPALSAIKEEIEGEFGYWDTPNTILSGDPAIFNCRYIIADFYRSFAARLLQMMENNSSTDLISVEGA